MNNLAPWPVNTSTKLYHKVFLTFCNNTNPFVFQSLKLTWPAHLSLIPEINYVHSLVLDTLQLSIPPVIPISHPCLPFLPSQTRFTCRSAEYNSLTTSCVTSKSDRRTPGVKQLPSIEVDYFENLCLTSEYHSITGETC